MRAGVSCRPYRQTIPPPPAPDLPGIPKPGSATGSGETYGGSVTTSQSSWGGSSHADMPTVCVVSRVDLYYESNWIGVVLIDCT
jgi:hypothetical protein